MYDHEREMGIRVGVIHTPRYAFRGICVYFKATARNEILEVYCLLTGRQPK